MFILQYLNNTILNLLKNNHLESYSRTIIKTNVANKTSSCKKIMNESNKMIIVLYVSLIETLYFRINSIGI